MSRVAKKPITIPAGVDVSLDGQALAVKGPKGQLGIDIHPSVEVVETEGTLQCAPRGKRQADMALAGTLRAVIANMVHGVSAGFERKLELRGVGYRAQAQGNTLNLTLGFSHPVAHVMPEGVSVETPSQTEVVLRGVDKQLVGQVAAQVRAYRPPEPYKGKGVRYAGEKVIIKEAKKK
jgi:large subunit ribosomal protein L6